MAVPVPHPSPQYELESPASPQTVKTPPTTVRKSSLSTTKGVRSPLMSPGTQPSQPALERSPAMSPPPMTTQPQSSMGSHMEVVSPQGTRVGYSFDSDETEPYAVHENHPWWQLLWAFCSIVFITVLIPAVIFLMSRTRVVRAPPNFPSNRATTSANTTSSPWTISWTTGLPRVTFDVDEDYLLQPGETEKDFCEREMEPDRSPTSPH
ncbi:hypothetical protein MRX96_020583 [Rhipicephalus microplus]